MNNLHISAPTPSQSAYNNEKSYHAPSPAPTPSGPPPPAYNAAPAVAMARALYAYVPTDTGDLALMPQDRVTILEYMNADWAKGRSERTGEEGIFPRSYVKVEEEKGGAPPLPPINAGGYGQQQQQQSSYGNMPMDVSQGPGQPQPESKVNTQGKKFGKKLGNAGKSRVCVVLCLTTTWADRRRVAVFGAGATIGSNIVNSIF
jgi:hypothetical protein